MIKRCRHMRRWMSEELDGVLDPGRAAVLRDHVQGCPACARERAEWETIMRCTRRLPDVDPPSDLLEHVRARLAAESVTPPARRTWYVRSRLSMAVAAACLLGLGLYGFWEFTRPHPVSDVTSSCPERSPRKSRQEAAVTAHTPEEAVRSAHPESSMADSSPSVGDSAVSPAGSAPASTLREKVGHPVPAVASPREMPLAIPSKQDTSLPAAGPPSSGETARHIPSAGKKDREPLLHTTKHVLNDRKPVISTLPSITSPRDTDARAASPSHAIARIVEAGAGHEDQVLRAVGTPPVSPKRRPVDDAKEGLPSDGIVMASPKVRSVPTEETVATRQEGTLAASQSLGAGKIETGESDRWGHAERHVSVVPRKKGIPEDSVYIIRIRTTDPAAVAAVVESFEKGNTTGSARTDKQRVRTQQPPAQRMETTEPQIGFGKDEALAAGHTAPVISLQLRRRQVPVFLDTLRSFGSVMVEQGPKNKSFALENASNAFSRSGLHAVLPPSQDESDLIMVRLYVFAP